MSEIVVIEQIRMTHEGPVNENGDPIHLQQGSLDGACGPYCLFMSFIICGLADHNNLVNLLPVRKNSIVGKAFIRMEEKGKEQNGKEQNGAYLLFRTGTDLSDLQEFAESNGYVATEPVEAIKHHKNSNAYKVNGKTHSTSIVKEFVVDQVKKNNPVILWLNIDDDSAHWVVVIGLEYLNDKARERKKVSRFLLLDPDAPSPTVSAWNGAVEISSRKELHSWGNRSGKISVRFDKALAIKRR